jgi:hypothetical protein
MTRSRRWISALRRSTPLLVRSGNASTAVVQRQCQYGGSVVNATLERGHRSGSGLVNVGGKPSEQGAGRFQIRRIEDGVQSHVDLFRGRGIFSLILDA